MPQPEPDMTWCRVLSGPRYPVCLAWEQRRKLADDVTAALAREVGANPEHRLSRGHWVEGLYRPFTRFAALPGWRPAGKTFPGFIKPNTRTAVGRAWKARLDAIVLETPESLAKDLGLPPFFGNTLLGTGFCSAVECFMRGGVFYLEVPAPLSRYFPPGEGIEAIQEWEYIRARDTP